MADTKNLADLFHDTLKDVYFAEKKIVDTLPLMNEAAKNGSLKDAFTQHLAETKGSHRSAGESVQDHRQGSGA